jgi:hypothetical protein
VIYIERRASGCNDAAVEVERAVDCRGDGSIGHRIEEAD